MKANLFKFFAALFCVAACVGFSSCGDDDDDDDFGGLVGSWIEAGYVQENGEIYWETDPEESMTFNADGTMVSYYEGTIDATGTYSVNGDVIVAHMVDAEDPSDRWTETGTFAIQGDLLYITFGEEEDGDYYYYTNVYKRIG